MPRCFADTDYATRQSSHASLSQRPCRGPVLGSDIVRKSSGEKPPQHNANSQTRSPSLAPWSHCNRLQSRTTQVANSKFESPGSVWISEESLLTNRIIVRTSTSTDTVLLSCPSCSGPHQTAPGLRCETCRCKICTCCGC